MNSKMAHPIDLINSSCSVVTRYTSKEGAVYAIALEWPSSGVLNLTLPIPSSSTSVTMLGLPDVDLPWKAMPGKSGIMVMLSQLTLDELPCKWAWVFKMTGVK